MTEKGSPHSGHRARMRNRFLSSEPSSFAEHEILEMLLYYTNPRRDTNETAHALIERFGSLAAVLDADVAHLESVDGVGAQSALFLSLVGEAAKRYTAEKFSTESKRTVLDTPEALAAFLAPRFIGATRELFYVLLLDNSLRPIDCFLLGDGTVSNVLVSTRSIAERALAKHAAAVVIAHNHPSGISLPSGEDVSMTHRIRESLSLLDIVLVEHFVFSDRSYTPILGKIENHEPQAFAASPIFEILNKNMKKKGNQ